MKGVLNYNRRIRLNSCKYCVTHYKLEIFLELWPTNYKREINLECSSSSSPIYSRSFPGFLCCWSVPRNSCTRAHSYPILPPYSVGLWR